MRGFRRLPLILVLLHAAAVAASSEQTVRRVAVYDGLASLEVPATWGEIPPEALEFLSLEATEASGGRTAELYQFGFRPGEADTGFTLPQILIQIRESGRLPYGRFLHLPPVSVLNSQDGDPAREWAGSRLQHVTLKDATFDRESYSLRTSHSFYLENVGRVVVESASFLTERGVFTVHCYTAASSASLDRPLFAYVLASVHFDPHIAYRPRLSDRWPPSPATAAFAAAALFAFLLLVIAWRRRHRRS